MAKKQSPKEIFNQALELKDPEKQAAFLDEACAGDEKVRAEVEALLKWDGEAGSFMDFPDKDPNVTLEAAPTPDITGTVIGRYKLLEKIGEGGMATVYMAEQKRPMRRRVALKIIKLGMDTKQVIARFEAERQALAMMDHPNIAKVFDAGSTDSRRPYFVMELVKGLPITEFCDTNHLTTQERLDLFISVCQAVHHAHQKGIIHRDIKPTNIMITLHDGKPAVKVIDFGIAKAVNQQLTEKTVFTRYSQMIGTPEYMSPEQAEMSGLDIDTRTDVFSLGVLLYELLTGVTPFDSEYLLSKGYGELQRIIREEEPVKPSTKISTLGESITDVAKHRRTSPELLCNLIRTDLDWIVMKTLEKDRQRRYESVSELAADVKRHLDNETVLAGRPSAVYRLQKFIKRNRVLVSAVTSVAVVIVLAAIISTALAVKATQARNLAEEAQRIAEHARQDEKLQRGKAEQATQAEAKERANAEQARREAEALAEERRQELYFNHIKLAYQELNANRPVHALDLLKDCPSDLRNWEWRYLHRKSHFQEPPSIGFDTSVLNFACSPDGSKLAVLRTDGNLVIRDCATGRVISSKARKVIEQIGPESNWLWPQRLAFCPDSKHIAVAGDSNIAKLYSITSEEISFVMSYKGHSNTLVRIACSPDGSLIATSSYDSTVRLWDRWKGIQLGKLRFDRYQTALAFAGHGKHLIVGGGGYIKQFLVDDILNGKEIPINSIFIGYEVFDITVSPDGQRIAAALWDDKVMISDSEYKNVEYFKGHINSVLGVEFNANGTRLASISDDRTLRIWDTATGREILVLGGFSSFLYDIAFGKDGHELIAHDITNSLKAFNATPMGESKPVISNALPGHTEALYTVNYSPSGDQVISSSHDGIPRIWDALDGHLIHELNNIGEEDSVDAQFSPDGNYIAVMCIPESKWAVKVLDAKRPDQELYSKEFDLETLALTFSRNSRYVIIGGMDETLRVYDWRSGDKTGFILGEQDDYIYSIIASPDGKHLASVGISGNVMVWDATRLQEYQEGRIVYTNNFSFFTPSFSTDSKQLAVGGRDGEIRILDVESGETLVHIPNAHGEKVSGVSFGPNGKYLASCSSDKTVRIWETQTRRQVGIFFKHEERLLSVAFSPDGKQVASAGVDKMVRIWTPNLD